jgi:hypothetical protein
MATSSQAQRIVAVGDLHGDWSAWNRIAQAAGLIDGRGRWAGGRTTLVQTGDIADRGPNSLKIIRHLMRLQREAPRAGGRVIVLIGNHEAMNMTGDLRYVHPGEFAAFVDRNSEGRREAAYAANRALIDAAWKKRAPDLDPTLIKRAWFAETPLGKLEHQAAWSADGEIGRWLLRQPAVVKVRDSLFVHGGLGPAYASLGIEEINRRVAAALARRETHQSSILNDPEGPLWHRRYALRERSAEQPFAASAASRQTAPPTPEQELAAVLQMTGAARMIIGHTPARAGIQTAYGGRLVRIDTGISSYYGGVLSFLEIRDGAVVPHKVPRPIAGRGAH